MATNEYMTSRTYSATIGGVVYSVSAAVGGTMDYATDKTFGGDVTVDGDLTVGGALVADAITGPTTVTGTLASTGNMTAGGDLEVTGGDIALNGSKSLAHGTGTPEGVVTAPIGCLYLDLTGTPGHTAWVKESGTGNTGWHVIQTEAEEEAVSWSMPPTGTVTGTHYVAGFYEFATTANDFNPSVNFGTANNARGARLFFVTAAGATDTQITVTGTSITDTGTRTGGDTEVVSLVSGSANVYYETSKKWLGQIAIAKSAGTDRLCNYGFVKKWDCQDHDFIVAGLACNWLSGATDAAFDIRLYHHKATGWTYNAGAEPTPPTPLKSLATIYSTERSTINGKQGAFKIIGMTTAVSGSTTEGIIFGVVTGANNAISGGTIMLYYTKS